MPRHEFPRKVKSAAWDRCKGRCEKCTAKLFPGKFAYDHIVPDQLGGEPVLSNCQVLCDACHFDKTGKQDVPAIRKSDRQRDKFSGAFKRKSKGFRKAPPQRSASRPLSKRVGQFGEQQ